MSVITKQAVSGLVGTCPHCNHVLTNFTCSDLTYTCGVCDHTFCGVCKTGSGMDDCQCEVDWCYTCDRMDLYCTCMKK